LKKLTAALVAVLALTFIAAGAASAQTSGSAPVSAAAAYCVQEGGVVENRIPWYGTNGNDPLQLSGSRDFCRFTSNTDDSRIYVDLQTLYTQTASLAALAYYAEVQPGSCEGNPASCYCSLLGGSDQFGGTTGAGGGWVKREAIDVVLEACIFPDLSTIDSWGLFYHSAGIIRGIDLNGILRYPDPYESAKKKLDAK